MATIAENLQILENHLEDAYTAIENKGGTIPTTHNATNLSAAIETIPEGGGEVEAIYNDVCFYRPDGFRLYSYTKEQVMADDFVMPELKQWNVVWDTVNGKETIEMLPMRWNYTLAEIRTQLNEGGFCDVGLLYNIADYATTFAHIKIDIQGRENEKRDFRLHCCFTPSITITINWGDGSETDYNVSSGVYYDFTHTYSNPGTYHISINTASTSNATMNIGGSASHTIYGESATNAETNPIPRSFCAMISQVLLGSRFKFGAYGFYYCTNLEFVSNPGLAIATNLFEYCINLKALILGERHISSYLCRYCYSLETVSINSIDGTTSTYPFSTCYSLKRVAFPRYNTTGGYVLQNCWSLWKVSIPDTQRTIGNYSFHTCYELRTIVFPSALTTLGTYLFTNDRNLELLDFRKVSRVPTLGANNFTTNNPNLKIVVPDNLYDSWIVAANWSAVASYIVKASDYTE